jgi:enoyl-CoA hydratase/carnithine racemase
VSQLRIDKSNPRSWRVTFDNPPRNLSDAATIRELSTLVDDLEADEEVRVAVFDSADPDYFIAHFDIARDPVETTSLPPGKTGLPFPLDFTNRLSRVPAITISAIRGRTRGYGSEIVLATDLRFASRERAVLGQPEVGLGLVPGGGAPARLGTLVGRARALEILIAGNDIDADLAERYGYVNRAVDDADLDAFVDEIAARIAAFDKQAIAETKKYVDQVTLPDDAVFPPALESFWASTGRPAAQQRIGALVQRGLQQRGDVEHDLGEHLPGAVAAE